MEKEQLKVCTKTLELDFQNIGSLKPLWHRLMMLEGLYEAEGGSGKLEEQGKIAVSLLAWDLSLEANSRSAIRQQHLTANQEHGGSRQRLAQCVSTHTHSP